MSTPSTLTTTLPPPHASHYGYQPYQTSPHRFASTNSATNPSARLGQSYSNYPNNTPTSIPRNPSRTSVSRQQPSQAMSASISAAEGSKKRKGDGADWDEFYKNGIPKEIIVIDDDTPPRKTKTEPGKTVHPPGGGPNDTTYTARDDSFEQHAAKKRKTAQGTAYQQDKYSQPAYSYKSRSDEVSSGANTISTERTTSLHTTAPTSLGSHTSQGSAGAYLEDGMVGQKRKRVVTRGALAKEKEKQDVEITGAAWVSYVPPPKPPIKAKEVHVPPVKDVRIQSCRCGDVCGTDS